jgi:chromate transporter
MLLRSFYGAALMADALLPPHDFIKLWAKIGALSFGGPAGQIALMQRELVDERKLIEPERFAQALNFCMLLPGPEAQQLATYCGWMHSGVRGGLIAGLLFILPGAAMMLALSILYVTIGQVPLMQGLFFGIQAAVVAIVIEALIKVGKRALKARWHMAVALFAFVALYLLKWPFPLVIALAAIVGLLVSKAAAPEAVAARQPINWRAIGSGMLLWLLPTVLLLAFTGFSIFSELAIFFSQMAVVTFGGAYAVLAYVSQYAVSSAGWISKAQMMDGLGLAETTPGPLILVLQFVGFLAAYQSGGIWAGIAGSIITLWVTFTPSFILIFGFAPMMDRLRQNAKLQGALSAITAAVVGVIAALALSFALHVLFEVARDQPLGPFQPLLPVWGTFDIRAGLLAFAAVLLLIFAKRPMWQVLAICGAAGALMRL